SARRRLRQRSVDRAALRAQHGLLIRPRTTAQDGLAGCPPARFLLSHARQRSFDAHLPRPQFVNARWLRLTPNLMEALCIAPTCQSSDVSFAWLLEVRASRRRTI